MNKRDEIIKYRFTDPKRAYDSCCELLEQGMQSGNEYEKAYAYLYMGDTLFSMGKFEDALVYMSLAEKVQKKNGFYDLLMKNYNIVGSIYITIDDALLAMEYYHRALKLAKKYKNFTIEAMVNSNIGWLLSYIGDPAEAAKYYKLAYNCSLEKEDKDGDITFSVIQLYLNISEGYLKEEKYKKALEYLNDVLKTVDSDKLMPLDEMKVARVYAMIHYGLKDYKKHMKCVCRQSLCADWTGRMLRYLMIIWILSGLWFGPDILRRPKSFFLTWIVLQNRWILTAEDLQYAAAVSGFMRKQGKMRNERKS